MGTFEESRTVGGCDNCGDDLTPKQMLALASNGNSCDSLGAFCDPIQEEIKDLEQERLTFSLFPIVPFMDGSDATLRLLRKQKTYSPTHGSCISSLADYVLNGELDVIRNKRAGFKAKRPLEEVTDDEFNAFIDFIEALNPDFNGARLLSEARRVFLNYKTYGNAFVRMDLVEVAGERYVYIYNIDAEMCRYWISLKDEPKMILVSEIWTDDYIQRHPPEFLSVFPEFTENQDGVQSTIIHCKNEVEGRDWYGLPDSISSFFYQYLEVQLGDYSTKGYANRWTGDILIETASDEEEGSTHTTSFRTALKKTFTNKGDGERIVHRNRLSDDPQTFIYEFKEDKSWEFHKHESQRAEEQIIKSHNWHKVLMGLPTPGKLGNETGEGFRELYKNKYYNVIKPLQVKTMQPFNMLFKVAAEFLNYTVEGGALITDRYSVALSNLYQDLMVADAVEENIEENITTDDNTVPVLSESDAA